MNTVLLTLKDRSVDLLLGRETALLPILVRVAGGEHSKLRYVTYDHFVSLMPRTLGLLTVLLSYFFAKSWEISFIDATPLAICYKKRIFNHKVFQGLAARGRTLFYLLGQRKRNGFLSDTLNRAIRLALLNYPC